VVLLCGLLPVGDLQPVNSTTTAKPGGSYRLPGNVSPTNYALNITINVEEATTKGQVVIIATVKKASSRITLHSDPKLINITKDKVTAVFLSTTVRLFCPDHFIVGKLYMTRCTGPSSGSSGPRRPQFRSIPKGKRPHGDAKTTSPNQRFWTGRLHR
jgi:transcription elongation factor